MEEKKEPKPLNLEQMFKEEFITKAEDVFGALDGLSADWTGNYQKYPDEYRKRVRTLLAEFKQSLSSHVLFDCPSGLWGYSIVVRGSGVYLYLDHYRGTTWDRMRQMDFFEKDESYEIACLKTKLLTVEEYAALHGVEHVTAVTRIRRGKIRSAIKIGSQWRIPELAEPVQRGYQSTSYTWKGRLNGLPDRFQMIADYNRAEFFQDDKDLTQFHVRFSGDTVEPIEFTCLRRQRGQIEQVLIAHPDVTCTSDVICCTDKKRIAS